LARKRYAVQNKIRKKYRAFFRISLFKNKMGTALLTTGYQIPAHTFAATVGAD